MFINNMITKKVVDDQLFVYYNEELIYKRWLKTGESVVFESVGYPTSNRLRNKEVTKRSNKEK